MSTGEGNWEQKDMSGNCHKQDLTSKTAEEREWMAPWSGNGMIEGKMYWINMYDNVSKAGNTYRKMTFKPMEPSTSFNKRPESAEKPKAFKSDDDIPW
tara:strand:- start:27 stop:320 length:294 start_codon:yes stop_codon:yes gene_type:complete